MFFSLLVGLFVCLFWFFTCMPSFLVRGFHSMLAVEAPTLSAELAADAADGEMKMRQAEGARKTE